MGNILKKPKKPTTNTTEDQVIHKIVDRYLSNHMINNTVIPDSIERQIYTNILKLAIGLLKDTLEHTHVEVLGHKIKFQVVSCESSEPTNPSELKRSNST